MARLNPSIDEMAADAWYFVQKKPTQAAWRNLFGRMLEAYGYVVKKWGDAVAKGKRVVLAGDWEIVQL